MATKRQGVACYDKAGQDEPLFVLRAQDVLSAPTVRFWAALASGGATDPEVIKEAFECAIQMEHWHFHKWPGISKIRHQSDESVEKAGLLRELIAKWELYRDLEGQHPALYEVWQTAIRELETAIEGEQGKQHICPTCGNTCKIIHTNPTCLEKQP